MTEEVITNLSEDMELVGPGKILAAAREKAGLSKQDVAGRLNFHLKLVNDIESEVFDKSLPATYNRGYLKNYAKLVNVSVEEVLASYELLGVAEEQCAEMQSFSKITEKQAHNTLLMTISYLILAVLIGATVMVWLQSNNEDKSISQSAINDDSSGKVVEETALNESSKTKVVELDQQATEQNTTGDLGANSTSTSDNIVANDKNSSVALTGEQLIKPAAEDGMANAVFKFSGDCWVNIYDANGERIAWGVKKSGYEMQINGLAPLSVTLGKPELVKITFNGATIDMAQFQKGNIAKFSLPVLTSNP